MTKICAQNIVLITGAAGFIGFHLALRFLRDGWRVFGADNPAFFDAEDIRCQRMDILLREGAKIFAGDLSSRQFAGDIFAVRPRIAFHLAARAGARCRNVGEFCKNNVEGFVNVLAAARRRPPAHLLFASSSSVYGKFAPRPFCENYAPVPTGSPYADSKILNEQIAQFYAQDGIFPVTGVRFFNVYGPWGRKDMAFFRFADCLAHDRRVPIISGDAMRSWLYIEDAVAACVALAKLPPENQYRVVNVAGPRMVRTTDALAMIARKTKRVPRIVRCPPEFPELDANPADLRLLESLTGAVPETDLDEGLNKFLEWHNSYVRENEQPRRVAAANG